MEYEQDGSQASAILHREILQIVEEMRLLRQDFDEKIKQNENQERLIESLQSELQDYRAGLHFKILRPMIFALISMHDELGKLIDSSSREGGKTSTAQILKSLEAFQITVEEILQSNGVEPYSVEGKIFVSGKQRSLQTVETIDLFLDKQIACRVSKGFAYDKNVLRPELVMTYQAVVRK